MIDTLKLPIVLVERSHKRDNLDCGNPHLNEYLARYALQNQKANCGQTYVAVDSNQIIYGYYTLCSASFTMDKEKIPKGMKNNLPNPIPAALIARLAVDTKFKKNGLGTRLLIHAVTQVYEASKIIGTCGVLVDAKDDLVMNFYAKHGFIPLESDRRMFLPMTTIYSLFKNPLAAK